MHGESSRSSLLLILALGWLLALAAATGYRIKRTYYTGPEEPPRVGAGFCDFFNGIYYPTKAFWLRDNPYTPQYAQQYPVDRQVPPFSPLVFVIHTPLTWFAPQTSAKLYFGWLMALTLLFSALTLKASHRPVTAAALFGVAGYVLFSRAGQVSVFSGYFTFVLVIGVILALHYADNKPLLAGLGLALASCKPTFAIPLVLLMLARRNLAATLIGVGLSAFFLGAGLGWLAIDDSFSGAVRKFVQAQDAHGEFPNLWPVNTWTRVDLLAILAKWNHWRPDGTATLLAMLGILAVPCGLLFKFTRPSSVSSLDAGSSGFLGLLCMLAMLVSVYHHYYDALLLVVPTSAMVLRPTSDWKHVHLVHRVALACLINVPLLNYLSARSILNRLDLEPGMPAYALITSVNGICLAIAVVYVSALAWNRQIHPRTVAAAVA